MKNVKRQFRREMWRQNEGSNILTVRLGTRDGGIRLGHLAKYPSVLHGEDLDKVGEGILKVGQDVASTLGTGCTGVLFNERAETFNILRVRDGIEVNHIEVAVAVKEVLFVPDVGDAATHTGAKVVTCWAEHDNTPAGHIFTAVVTCALHHSTGAGVAHGKTFSHLPADEHFATRSAVEKHVTRNDIVSRHIGTLPFPT